MILYSYHKRYFNIYETDIDPSRSPRARGVPCYPIEVRKLYKSLGIESAIWCFQTAIPNDRLKYEVLQHGDQKCEYTIEVDESRIAGWVDDSEWDKYLLHVDISMMENPALTSKDFSFAHWSKTPLNYPKVSILIEAPIKKDQDKVLACYAISNRFGQIERKASEIV